MPPRGMHPTIRARGSSDALPIPSANGQEGIAACPFGASSDRRAAETSAVWVRGAYVRGLVDLGRASVRAIDQRMLRPLL
jgi:hypothetical protein